MNAPSPAHQRASPPHTNASEVAPAIVQMARADQRAANDAAEAAAEKPHVVNPLWMVAAAMMILFAVFAVLVSSS